MSNISHREELKQKISQFHTLDDVIQVALAQLPRTQFSSDSNNWSAALFELWTDYHAKVPEFEKLSFTSRPPFPPQADEAYQLITTFAMSGRVGLPNPRLHRVIMSKATKEKVKRDKAEVQNKYNDILPEMAQILEKHLSKV